MKIMIDAGHYGKTYNPGVVKGYYESEQMWKLHLLLKAALEGYGIKVDATRKNQNDNPGTDERGRMSKGYDLFVSLHSNAVDLKLNPSGETIDRPVMLAYQDLSWTNIDDISVGLSKKLGEAVQKVMDTKEAYDIWQRKASTDRDGNGILDDEYYGVLKGARIVGVPGLLIEHSFHTNKRACEWLLKEDNLKALAEAEARTIAEYFGIVKPAEQGNKTVKITAFALTIRKGAGTNFGVAGYLILGAKVDICEIADGWGRLTDGRGWIGLKYTEEIEQPQISQLINVGKKVKVTADVLTIRKGIGTSYAVAGYLKKDNIVTITEEKDNWGKLEDGRGWIGLKYTKSI